MFREQILVIKKYIDEMLEKEYIRSSTLFYVVSILIVKKLDDGLRLCVNYRALNTLIISNRNASPLIKEILIKLYAARIYSKFDIIVIFNKIRVKDKHEKKMAFFTRYDLYEYIIISFKLYNASITFQAFINNILRKYLDVFYIAYLDNILIYSNIKKKYIYYISKILKKLQQANLYLDINKCDFHTIRVKYLDLIITINEVEINFKKIEAITQWKESRYTKNM